MSRVLWINPGYRRFRTSSPCRARTCQTAGHLSSRSALCTAAPSSRVPRYEAWVTPDVLTSVVQAEREGFDAAVIGCFYDTGLRRLASCTRSWSPLRASRTAHRVDAGDSFSVIVGRRKWVPEMRDNVTDTGSGTGWPRQGVRARGPRFPDRSERTRDRLTRRPTRR